MEKVLNRDFSFKKLKQHFEQSENTDLALREVLLKVLDIFNLNVIALINFQEIKEVDDITLKIFRGSNFNKRFWLEIKKQFFLSSKTNNNEEFHLFTEHSSAYCFPNISAEWFVIVSEEPFTNRFLEQLRLFLANLNKLILEAQVPKTKSEVDFLSFSGKLPIIFKNVIENTSESVLISDMSGTLCYANKTSRNWLGIGLNANITAIKSYHYEEYLSEGDTLQKWENHIKELRTSQFLRKKIHIKNVNTDQIINTEAEISIIQLQNQEYVLAISKGFRESLDFKDIFMKDTRLHKTLLKMASMYINLDISEVSTVIHKSLEEIGKSINADRAYIFEYDFINGIAANTYEWCEKGIKSEIDHLKEVPISFIASWVKRHQKNLPFLIDDVTDLPDLVGGLKSILEPDGVKGLITLPMFARGRLVGFVGFDSIKNVKYYSKDEKNLLLVYAEILINIGLRHQYDQEIIQQKNLFRNIISSTNLSLIEIDTNFKITFSNNSFLKFYHYKSEDILGKNVLKLFLQDESSRDLERKMQEMINKEVLTLELNTKDRNGVSRPILASIVKYGEGLTQGYLGSLMDLSPQKELERELRQAAKKTQEASKAKEQFFANMSHELRTPLNIINGSLTEVAKQNISKDAHFLLDQAIVASRHMLNLVNNVLDLAKINAGEIKYEKKDFNLLIKLEETFNIFKLMAKEKGLAYHLKIDDNLHEYVTGDFGKTNQVLINLLSNALKFTNKGKIILTVKTKRNYTNHQLISFMIQDTGVGMDESFIKEIFEEYKQDILVNNLQSGTGLGMTISKSLIEVMGGKISVKSKKNRGTKVEFILPFDKRDIPRYSTVIYQHKKLFKNLQFLIAEDNYMNALLLERKIRDLGAQVTKVENGQIALKALESQKFDLIFMDIQMPVLDGLAATKIIRGKLKIETPIIAITANVFKNDVEEYLASGMNDVILKPFEDQILYAKVITILGLSKNILDNINTSGTNDSLSVIKEYNLDKLKKLSNGDKDFYTKMLTVFIDLAINTSKDLAYGIKHNDLDVIAKSVHKIKPSIKDLDIFSVLSLIEIIDGSEYKDTNFVVIKARALLKELKGIVKNLKEEYFSE